jgi:hypothetical protein
MRVASREGDAIAAARRRLPMVEMDSAIPLIGEGGAVTLLDAFEGRRLLIAHYFMWHTGRPAPEQCEGCTWVTSQVRELSYIHSRDVTYATFCQGPYEETPGTATSWAGRCLGTRPRTRSTPSWLDAEWAGCTSFATCEKDPMSSRHTGRRAAASRPDRHAEGLPAVRRLARPCGILEPVTKP